MLTLWLLLLFNLTAILSSSLSSVGKQVKTARAKKRKVQELDLDHRPETKKLSKVSTKPEWVPFSIPVKKQHMLLCEQLKSKAEGLGLLQKGKRLPGSICELPWDPEAVMDLKEDDDALQKQLCVDGYRRYDWLKASKPRQTLVMPLGFDDPWLILQVNQRRYVLIAVIARLLDGKRNILTFCSFTVDKDGLLGTDFKHIPLVQSRDHCSKISFTLKNVSMLPQSLESPEGDSLDLKYEYGIYQVVSLWAPPYNLRHSSLTPKLVAKEDLKGFPEIKDKSKTLITQAFSLLRFIQVWDAIKPEEAFESGDLEEIRAQLQVLEEGKDEKAKGIVLKACRFLYDNRISDDFADYSFLAILRRRESTIQGSFFSDQESHRVPKMQLAEAVCDSLSNELMFDCQSSYVQQDHPYLLHIPCIDNPKKRAIFKLVARLDAWGNLFTFDNEYDPLRDEMIFKIATYGASSYVMPRTWLVSNLQELTISMYGALFIYQHFRPDKGFKRTKVAPRSYTIPLHSAMESHDK